MTELKFMTDEQLNEVFKQGVNFVVGKCSIEAGIQTDIFIVPDNVFPFVSNNQPAQTDGFTWEFSCACVHAHIIFCITLTDNDYTRNANSFYLIFCPHEVDKEKLQFYDYMLNKGEKPMTFGLFGVYNAERMSKHEEEHMTGLENNLSRHLVVFENVDVSNVRIDLVGTSLIDGIIHHGPKYVKSCNVCKAYAPRHP
jgi:hypothetical protein